MKPLRILVVEDDWLVALDLKHMLERRGREVVGTAADATEALAAALRTSPDLALVDVNFRDGPSGASISAAVVRETKTPVFL